MEVVCSEGEGTEAWRQWRGCLLCSPGNCMPVPSTSQSERGLEVQYNEFESKETREVASL